MPASILCYECGRAPWQHPRGVNCDVPAVRLVRERTQEEVIREHIRRDTRNGRRTP